MHLSCPIRTFLRNAGAHCMPTVNSHSLLCHTTHSLTLSLSLSHSHSLTLSSSGISSFAEHFPHCTEGSPLICTLFLCTTITPPLLHSILMPLHLHPIVTHTHTHTTSAQPPWVPLLSLLISGAAFSHLRSHTPLLAAPLTVVKSFLPLEG